MYYFSCQSIKLQIRRADFGRIGGKSDYKLYNKILIAHSQSSCTLLMFPLKDSYPNYSFWGTSLQKIARALTIVYLGCLTKISIASALNDFITSFLFFLRDNLYSSLVNLSLSLLCIRPPFFWFSYAPALENSHYIARSRIFRGSF